MAISKRDVFAFVDWDTARRCSWLPPIERARVRRRGAPAELEAVTKAIALACGRLGNARRQVYVRIYHGWHRGKEPTQDFRDLVGISPKQSTWGKVLVTPPVISDRLACGGPHATLRDTLRQRENSIDLEQKMVDTAIAADLLYLARTRTGGLEADFIVVSEDDDMLPPVIVAHQWGLVCKILRSRGPNRCLQKTGELLLPLSK